MTRAAEPYAGLSFEPAEHVYRLDGERLTGVTTVVGLLYRGPKASPERLAEAGRRGTIAHRLIDLDEMGDADAARHDPHVVLAARAARKALGFETVHVEKRMASARWRVAGTADRIGWFRRSLAADGAPWWREEWGEEALGILDWKTSRAIWPHYQAQLAAYRMLAAPLGVQPDAPLACVRLDGSGGWEAKVYRGPEPDLLWHAAWTIHAAGEDWNA